MAVIATELAPAVDAEAQPYRWRWFVLATVLAAEIMDLLDSTVVNVAAPTIRADLGGGLATLQWLAAGYTLAFAVMLITGGRLGDIVGRRRMFLIGAAGFALSSALCAAAQSPDMLIGSRVLQGAFGAVMIPQGFGMIKAVFPPTQLGAAFSLFGPVMGLSAVCGPLLAGALIDADWWGTSWRMVFLINVPVGLLALGGAARFMPESRLPGATRLDLVGALLVTAGSVLLIYPLVQGRELGWPLWTYLLMVAAVAIFTIFIWYERRRESSPLIELGLFAKRAFSGGLLVISTYFAGVMGFMLVFGLYTQLGLGYSPLRAGLTLTPWALGTAVGAALSGAVLGPRYGRRVIHSGLLVGAAGLLGVYGTLWHFGTRTGVWQLAPAVALAGLGMGLIIAPLFDVILTGVDDHEVGTASGVLNAMQQLGGAVGIAVLGTVFFSLLGSHPGAASGDPAGTAAVATQFTSAVQRTTLVVVGLFLLTFAAAFLLPRRGPASATHDGEQDGGHAGADD